MEVIGVGMGRTGTLSLKLALEELGYGPCYHMKEVMGRRDRIKTWRKVTDGTGMPDWDEVYSGFRSTVDWPGAGYWRELVDTYPKAKVILSVRDPEGWADSMFKTIIRFPLHRLSGIERFMYNFISLINPPAMAEPRMLDKVFRRVFGGHEFGRDRPADREYAIESFHKHNEDVKAYVPADRLLVHDVKEGWEPLCAFLGVPVPETPFPRVNDTEAFQKDIVARRNRSTFQVVASTTVIMTAALGVALLTHLLP
ncbi:MAG TPA: sulfotransferase [Actinocrinis sp.]|uniref:sulfotransferase family protein n=1 Tax=Actinocrinis sp. TaxID=1920516 RepID=UPI002DDCB5F5|nr:sulfotransferase [Actinocrinis sp.]HEV2346260.1 sulfotransferase [Actinocrinis sp.]